MVPGYLKGLLWGIVCSWGVMNASDYRIVRYGSSNGLPNDMVYDIVQDRQGFLWIATADGLCRYDGYRFTIYKANPGHQFHIGESPVNALYCSGKTLLAGAENIHCYDPLKDSFTEIRKNFEGKVQHFFALNDSLFLVQYTEPYGISLFIPSSQKFISAEKFIPKELIEKNIFSVYAANNELWVSCYADNSLYHLQLSANCSFKIIDRYSDIGNITAFCQQSGKPQLFCASTNGFLYEASHEKIKKIFNLRTLFPSGKIVIKNLLSAGDSSLWMLSDAGVYAVDLYRGKTEKINLFNETGLSSLSGLQQFLIDKYHQLWIASLNGLYKINLYRLPVFHVKTGNLAEDAIYSLCKDEKGILWIATARGLNAFNAAHQLLHNYTAASYPYPLLLNDIIYSMLPVRNGLLISSVGINFIDFANGKYGYVVPESEKPEGLHSYVIWKIVASRNSGHYWLATLNGLEEMIFTREEMPRGVFRMPVIFHHHLQDLNKNGRTCANVWDVYEEEENILWIATSCGLLLYHPQQQTYEQFTYDPADTASLSAKVARCICADSKGNLWIGTEGGGINRLLKKEKKFKRYMRRHGLAGDVVWGILEDANGYLWINTSLGVSRFDPQKEEFKNYGYAEGFQGNISGRGICYKDQNGYLYMGGNNGIDIFNPLLMKDHPVLPDVYITGIYLFNREIKVGEVINGDTLLTCQPSATKAIRLNHHNNVLGIAFSALHYLSPQKNRYAYILEGYDKAWTYTDASVRIANYMNLPPGNYRFKVKACNADGQWNQKAAELMVVVLPPFWNTWWFRILFLCSCVGLIAVFVRYRVHAVERQNRALEFLVTQRTEEISRQKEQLVRQADNLQEINILLKENQEKLLKQSEELQRTNRELSLANATKDTLFSIIAHDLKNPFHVILSTSQTLFSRFDNLNDLKKKEYASAINKAAGDIYLLLHNLLEWSRSQLNKIECNPEPIEMFSLIEEIFEVMQIHAGSKKIRLNNNLSKGTWIYADRHMLSTVFRNLISNAIKFNNIGGSVTIHAIPLGEEYEIIVSDTGIGIQEEKIKKLFNLETYFSSSGTSGEQGTGLGLIICKEFIEKNGGNIRVESSPGMGSNFIVRIRNASGKSHPPVPADVAITTAPENTSQASGEKTAEDVPYSPGHQGKIVLLAEDNSIIRQNLKEYLSSYFTILEAENGMEAFTIALQAVPDLVVSDVMMPELDGIGLVEKIKSDERTSHIPVILLTASDSETQRIKGLETGADDYILKPFNVDVLRIKMFNLIRIREELRQKYSRGLFSHPGEQKLKLSPDEQFLQHLQACIEKNISNQDFKVEDLCKEMAMSYIQFYRKVESLTGQSPAEMIRIIRLNKAAETLLQNGGNVSEAAYENGFKDPSYFAKLFKKHFGMSPTDYAKNKNSIPG